MSTGKSVTMRFFWGSSLLAALAVGCGENLTAPGACPQYCPVHRVDVIDSLFVGSIYADSAWVGYIRADQAERAQVVSDGTATESRAIIRFGRFSAEFNDQPIASIDSFRLRVGVIGRVAWPGLEFVAHRLPPDIDSATTHAALDPFFEDSTQIGILPLPDTLVADTISWFLPGDGFPTLVDDSMEAAIGLRLVSGPDGYADLSTIESLFPAQMTMYAQYVQGDSTIAVNEARAAVFDSYVSVDQAAPGPDVLGVGGAPSWRSFLRFDIPSLVTDSSDISRATLILVPSEPISGAMGDTLRLRADALTGDVGPKSPIFAPPRELWDTLSLGGLNLFPGVSDTVLIDVTHILKPLRADSARPHSIALWMVPEASSAGQARFWSSRNAASAPALFITYTPLFPREQR